MPTGPAGRRLGEDPRGHRQRAAGTPGSTPSSRPPLLSQGDSRPWRRCEPGGVRPDFPVWERVEAGTGAAGRCAGCPTRLPPRAGELSPSLHRRGHRGTERGLPRAHGQLMGQVFRPPGSGHVILLPGGRIIRGVGPAGKRAARGAPTWT